MSRDSNRVLNIGIKSQASTPPTYQVYGHTPPASLPRENHSKKHMVRSQQEFFPDVTIQQLLA